EAPAVIDEERLHDLLVDLRGRLDDVADRERGRCRLACGLERERIARRRLTAVRAVLLIGRETVAPHLERARIAGTHHLRVQPVAAREHHGRAGGLALHPALAREQRAVEHAAAVRRPARPLPAGAAFHLDLALHAIRFEHPARHLLALVHGGDDDARAVLGRPHAHEELRLPGAGITPGGWTRPRLRDRHPAAEPGQPAGVGGALRAGRARRETREHDREGDCPDRTMRAHASPPRQNVTARPTDIASPPRAMSSRSVWCSPLKSPAARPDPRLYRASATSAARVLTRSSAPPPM